jgi:sec-independent protein translocase protein TatB
MFAFIFDSVSFGEWTVLVVVFLIVMGPRKIPQTARTLGNYYSKLRRAAESFKRQLMDLETEFNKAAAEAEAEVKQVEDAFKSDGDESDVIPPSDAYYPTEVEPLDEPASDVSGESGSTSESTSVADEDKTSTAESDVKESDDAIKQS